MEATILSNPKLTFPAVCETPVAWGNLNLQRTDDYKAIVNPETGKVFSIVSKGYKLIRHEEAVFLIERVLNKSSPRYDLRTEFYNDGGRMLRTYRFFDKKVEIQKGDTVSPNCTYSTVMILPGLLLLPLAPSDSSVLTGW